MENWNRILVIPGVLLVLVFFATNLFSDQADTGNPSLKPSNLQSETCPQPRLGIQTPSLVLNEDAQLKKAEVSQKTKKLQIPFIANNGQTDERVRFYANTFGGTVFVTKEGEIVYALLKSDGSRLGEAEHTQQERLVGNLPQRYR